MAYISNSLICSSTIKNKYNHEIHYKFSNTINTSTLPTPRQSFFSQNISLFMRGNQFEDPINGYTYKKLLPYGRLRSRENALAPDSMSLERHRLIWLYLKRKLISLVII